MATATYVPGTLEADPKKLNMSLQQMGPKIDKLLTAGTGLVNSSGSLAVSLSTFTNTLAGDVALNNVANYFDGPSVAQPTGASAGTWFVSGTVTAVDTAANVAMRAKLWDGTTVIASTIVTAGGINNFVSMSLSGYITAPAGNLRISVKDAGAATGKIVFNSSGNSADSTITAIRIA